MNYPFLKHDIDGRKYQAAIQKEKTVQCPFCPLKFKNHSYDFHTHLLFTHNFYLETCKTFESKLLEKNTSLGFSLRKMGRKLKSNYKSTLRLRKSNLRYTIRKFFDLIEGEQN